ncbi:DUF6153 family protein [Streptomyces aureus]|uniref:DUF6153 family protein n=1 Tax=Streptomyces aureus TaxID=193461 RepID=UPI0033C01041
MNSSVRTGSKGSSARWMWLVLALVAGVLGMHALSPAGMPAAGRHDMVMATGERSAPVHAEGADCRHLTDAGESGMGMDHVGGTCAAGGTSTAYVPPALVPGESVRVEPVATADAGTGARQVDGRAPPDLSELQLLRI